MRKIIEITVATIALFCVVFTAAVLWRQSSVVETWAYQKGRLDREAEIVQILKAQQVNQSQNAESQEVQTQN